MKVQEPWRDDTISTGPKGFDYKERWYLFLFTPFRRNWDQNWFKVIARIGKDGMDEYSLNLIPGSTRDEFTAEIVPRKNGRLFLFVNDAVLPGPKGWQGFYKWNRGTALMTIA